MSFQVRLLGKILEADGALERLLFAVLPTVVHGIAFPVSHIGTDRTEVDLGTCHAHSPTPSVALNIGHCLQTVQKLRNNLSICHGPSL